MWKAIAITGGIVAVVCSFALWCAAMADILPVLVIVLQNY